MPKTISYETMPDGTTLHMSQVFDHPELTVGYVVTATREDGERLFMATDLSSGGCEYWSGINSARFYSTRQAAWEDFTRRSSSNIETFLHRASGADYKHPVREVILALERVATHAVWSQPFSFSLAGPSSDATS